jgi:hypothetical protein
MGSGKGSAFGKIKWIIEPGCIREPSYCQVGKALQNPAVCRSMDDGSSIDLRTAGFGNQSVQNPAVCRSMDDGSSIDLRTAGFGNQSVQNPAVRRSMDDPTSVSGGARSIGI